MKYNINQPVWEINVNSPKEYDKWSVRKKGVFIEKYKIRKMKLKTTALTLIALITLTACETESVEETVKFNTKSEQQDDSYVIIAGEKLKILKGYEVSPNARVICTGKNQEGKKIKLMVDGGKTIIGRYDSEGKQIGEIQETDMNVRSFVVWCASQGYAADC